MEREIVEVPRHVNYATAPSISLRRTIINACRMYTVHSSRYACVSYENVSGSRDISPMAIVYKGERGCLLDYELLEDMLRLLYSFLISSLMSRLAEHTIFSLQ
jgi:hypothetical protein